MSLMFNPIFVASSLAVFLAAGCATTARVGQDCTKAEIEQWAEKNKGVLSKGPVYPKSSRRAGESGVVKLTLDFMEPGSPAKISIRTSSGHKSLDEAALKFYSEAALTQPICGGQNTAVRIVLPVAFKLDDSPPNASQSEAGWAQAIRDKIRSNIILPKDTPAAISAVFSVVQLPSGEIIQITLKSSSGFLPYDQAVERAIVRSSPLPKPSDPQHFRRNLELRFTPCDPQDPATIARQGKCS